MKIGFTCSAFDLFHAGHITMLRDAKEHCDFLIVGLQTDPTIDRPTKNRPVQTVYERWVQLAACQYVDRIIPYATEKELLDILQSQAINIRFVGEEYQSQPFTGKDIDGIEIYYNKRRHSFSSTELRQRVFTAQITQQVNPSNYGTTLIGAAGAAGDPATYIPPTDVTKNSLR
jgi:glycerol-3-phosphate cytidylyltransferase